MVIFDSMTLGPCWEVSCHLMASKPRVHAWDGARGQYLVHTVMSPPCKGWETYCFSPCVCVSVGLSVCPSQNRVRSIT